ncbi:MAG: GGDEF domain-containing protein [Lachnospiraceae bacterium]|nr:GGDEF domain-containing protein [Lachnospiraceae bacterium]
MDQLNDNIIKAAFRAMLDDTKAMVFVKDMNLVYVAASMPFVKASGNEWLDDIVGKKDAQIFKNQELAKKYVMDDYKLFTNGKNLIDYIEPLPDEDGRARYASTSKYILKDDDGNNIGVLGVTRDITRDYMARQRYQTELQYLFELPDDTYAVSYMDVDDWRIITQRRQDVGNTTLQSCVSVEELYEAALESIVDSNCKAAEFYRNFTQNHLREIYDSGRTGLSFNYQRRLLDGSLHWVHNDLKFLTDVDSGHLCVMLSAKNIDLEKKQEEKLIEAAKRDQMTMLYNRETTMEYIEQFLSEYPQSMHALFMIDVDNFKSLNDTLGHQMGDEFLIELAKEVKSIFRESDIVGRIGGDEFFAFLSKVPDMTIVEKKAEELIQTIRRVCKKYPVVDLSGSIGISMYPKDGMTVDEMYAKADEALYQAKNHGKNQIVIV